MVKRYGTAACLALGALLAVPQGARAETIQFTGVGLGSAVSISVRNAAGSLVTQSVAAGELNWRWVMGTPEGFAANFYSYCVDALNYLQNPQTVEVEVTDSLSLGTPNRTTNAGAGDRVAWLFNTYASAVHSGGSGVAAAGLQVAIWEALYDTSASLSSGTFRLNTTGTVRTAANSYLTSLYSSNYAGSSATWLNTSRGQDQITHGVPEPSTLLLVAAGALLMRRRQPVAA